MTLFELQAWLGHRSPNTTRHYARITPTKFTKAYSDAGYFALNMRAIEVLIDRDAVETGIAASGAPWQYFDLGHGYCSYSFLEQCPHRVACARCDFYVPKDSSKAQLLEAKSNLQRMLVQIPLTDGERAAVEEGAAAVEQLLERLAETPTPAGPTPREMSATFIPQKNLSTGRLAIDTVILHKREVATTPGSHPRSKLSSRPSVRFGSARVTFTGFAGEPTSRWPLTNPMPTWTLAETRPRA